MKLVSPKCGLYLEYLTLGWNVAGSLISLAAGWTSSSVALAGFGLGSLIEVFTSLVVIWRLNDTGHDHQRHACHLIHRAFVGLALYVLIKAGYALFTERAPMPSVAGIGWLAATFTVLLLLADSKKQIGARLNNLVMTTAATATLSEAYLAASVLVGLTFNLLFGWWWADPLAALVIVSYACKADQHVWQGHA